MIGTKPKAEPQQQQDELLTVAEVAKHLRVDATTVRRWINSGALEAVVLPGKQRHFYRIKRSTMDRLLGGQEG